MKIAVAGGTGLIGRLVAEAAHLRGHDVAVISRAHGTDLVTGNGLAEALRGCDTVVDVSNSTGTSKAKSVAFFTAATRNLLTAGVEVGVRHHLALSIVGIDRVPLGYYEGKRRQEEIIAEGALPWTVLRATQFHEFPAQLLAQMKGPLVAVPRMECATIAAREVAQHLVDLAAGEPLGRAPEIAGSQVHQMPQLTRRLIQARGAHRLVLPVSIRGRIGKQMAHGGLLPTAPGPRGRQTFDEWLDEHERAR